MDWWIYFYTFIILYLIEFLHRLSVARTDPCDPSTYLELGKYGLINCSFEEPFYGVYWYLPSGEISTILYQDSIKKGTGYTSGEYDIYPNGSLSINTVMLHHENNFTVNYLSTRSALPVAFTVNIIVYVTPTPNFPLIRGCSNVAHDICFLQTKKQELHFACSLNDVRPNITLSWIKRTSTGDFTIPSKQFVTSGHLWHNSHVATSTTFQHPSVLQLLVCKVEKPPGLLEQKESLILVQSGSLHIPTNRKTTRLVERHSKLELRCDESLSMLMVWERYRKTNQEREVILYYGESRGKHMIHVVNDDYAIGASHNLEIQQIQVYHEGLYVCHFGDGSRNSLIGYHVKVYGQAENGSPVLQLATPYYSKLEMETRQLILDAIEEVFKSKEAQTLHAPTIVDAKNITDKYIAPYSRLINYFRNKSISLRFDNTVPFAKYVIEKNITSMKRYLIANVFRKSIENDELLKELRQCACQREAVLASYAQCLQF